jgi:predicted Zn-dependent protease
MERLHNMIYGDDPKDGLIKGRVFVHPAMRFSFKVPKGFQLYNSPRLVIGKGPNDSIIQFDTANKPNNSSMVNYIRKIWAPNTNFLKVDKINVNGMPGATTKTRTRQKNGAFDLRLTAIKYNNSRIYRFIYLTRVTQTQKLNLNLRQTIYSLRNISVSEAQKIRPNRVIVQAVEAKNSVKDISELMGIDSFKEETFRVINGLKPSENLRQGQLIKIISK